ncbi:hypothetical protein B0H11DRAFT_479554 [Mycena galericulata]|nr:hypothetical protein B0H11DRAFT_479554 [Mycena galericulata]
MSSLASESQSASDLFPVTFKINPNDPEDLLNLCQILLRRNYPLISPKECTTILAAEESLWDDLKQRVLKNIKNDEFLIKASDVFEKIKTAGNNISWLRLDFKIKPEPPPETAEEIMSRINIFVEELRPALVHFVGKGDPLQNWCPSDSGPDLSWLKSQGIPSSGRKPDLLLHKLGSFAESSELRRRLDLIFEQLPQGHTFLVNTSGSGKTRLMLEGLCLHWGFYFASLVDSTRLGSYDIENTIHSYLPNSPGFVEDLSTTGLTEELFALNQNRIIAQKRFTEVLLARIIIFQLFVEVIKNRTDIAEPKKLWLLLQLRPLDLGFSGGDCFDKLTSTLRNSPPHFVVSQIIERLQEIRQWSHRDYSSPALFIVLDEAQYAARGLFSAFRSARDNLLHRPILREIVRAWVAQSFKALGLWLIISGTGIDHNVMKQVLASAVMKPEDVRLISNIGAFSDVDEHIAFIERYIPPRILETLSGKALVKRMTYWLHGRHRFTTTFLAELLYQCFRSPHKLLNAFVKTYTDFAPSDGQQWIAQEPHDSQWPEALRLNSFDLPKLEQNVDMLTQIRKIINVQLIRSELATDVTIHEKRFVEYGVARHTESSTNQIIIDEPLVLFALSKIANSSQWYSNNIRAMMSTKSNGFEDYLAFVLPFLFESAPRLDRVFDFYGPKTPSWTSHRAELVSIRDDGWPIPDISRVLPNARPSFSYGFNAGADHKATVDWLKHRGPGSGSFICFPPNGMGPDLIFVLRVLDGSSPAPLLWVAVQAKYSEVPPHLGAETLRDAVRSVTPQRFWINKAGNHYAPVANPTLVDDTLRALKKLPNRMESGAGTYSLLRVVASCPVPAKMERADGWTSQKRVHYDDADDKHPIACLNRQFLADATSKLPPIDKMASMMDLVARNAVPPVPDLDLVIDDTASDLGIDNMDDEDKDMPRTRKRRNETDTAGSDSAPSAKRLNQGKGKTKGKGKGKAKSKAKGEKAAVSGKKSTRSKPRSRGDDVSMSATSMSVPPSNVGSSRAMSVSVPPSASSAVGSSTWSAGDYSVRSLRNRSKEY